MDSYLIKIITEFVSPMVEWNTVRRNSLKAQYTFLIQRTNYFDSAIKIQLLIEKLLPFDE